MPEICESNIGEPVRRQALSISFTVEEVYESIKKYIPNFTITYKPDFRQAIADSWPASIDDSVAKKDWGLKVDYDLDKMTQVMLKKVEEQLR